MTNRDKIQIFEQTELMRLRFERKYSVVFARVINNQIKSWLKEADSEGFEVAANNVGMYATYDSMRRAFFDMYVEVGRSFNKVTENEIKSALGRFETKDFEMPDSVFVMNLNTFIDQQLGRKITFINQTTQSWMTKSVARVTEIGIKRGDNINTITENLRSFFAQEVPDFAAWRARRIARTEVVSASNYSKSQVMETIAPDGLRRIWIADMRDLERTREAHQNVEPVGMRDKFNVGGEFLEYPGDPNGSAGNVINCRCTVGIERI